MQIKTIEVSGFVSCFNTLRKPFKKEVRSIINQNHYCEPCDYNSENLTDIAYTNKVLVDSKDLRLLQRLIKNGDEHAKAIRLITVTAEIQAPLFWWSEMDTYEIGVVNGCSESTMHTLKNEKLTYDSFENGNITDYQLEQLNKAIKEESIELIKGLLPSGYLQTRDINFSYQTLARICRQRTGHKLPQWQVFIDWIRTLPLAEELIFNNGNSIKE